MIDGFTCCNLKFEETFQFHLHLKGSNRTPVWNIIVMIHIIRKVRFCMQLDRPCFHSHQTTQIWWVTQVGMQVVVIQGLNFVVRTKILTILWKRSFVVLLKFSTHGTYGNLFGHFQNGCNWQVVANCGSSVFIYL